jgi:hypothetical protein
MKLLRTPHFERNYAKASQQVQRAFDKQSLRLLQNLHHPSLRAKKYDESRGLWPGHRYRNCELQSRSFTYPFHSGRLLPSEKGLSIK